MSKMLTRAITGAGYVIVMVGAITISPYGLMLLGVIFIGLGVNEFFTLLKKVQVKANNAGAIVSACSVFLTFALVQMELIQSYWIFLGLVPSIITLLSELYRKSSKSLHNIAYFIMSMGYIVLPITAFFVIAFFDDYRFGSTFNYRVLLGYVIMIWTCDTGAYLSGKSFGKHKLFERISPNKTIEGSAGGMLLTVGAAFVFAEYLGGLVLLDWIIVAILVSVFGTYGDLFESLVKRKIGVKDSGNILPGHGGILDRIDSILLSAPVLLIFLKVLDQG